MKSENRLLRLHEIIDRVLIELIINRRTTKIRNS